jgi:hypothetical protein
MIVTSGTGGGNGKRGGGQILMPIMGSLKQSGFLSGLGRIVCVGCVPGIVVLLILTSCVVYGGTVVVVVVDFVLYVTMGGVQVVVVLMGGNTIAHG